MKPTILRSVEMARLYAEGLTLAEVGARFGITRERARQIIKTRGLTGKDGGWVIKMAQKAEQRRQRKDACYVARWGHDYDTHERVRLLPGSPRERFTCQRNNAVRRGIEWQLTFAEWWGVWEASGHWAERGRGQDRYVMSRVGDVGPYALDNVFIQLSTDNNSLTINRRSYLPKGVVLTRWAYVAKKMVNGKKHHIGSFHTPEEAGNAYLDFDCTKP